MKNNTANAMISVIRSIQRRRRWSAAGKMKILAETEVPGMSMSFVARKHGVAATKIFKWKKMKESGALTAVDSEEDVLPVSSVKQVQERLISKYRRLDPHSIDFCFPNPDGFFFENLSQNQRIYWIPDFQEDHFPDFFSPAEIQGRKNQHAGLVRKKASIVFSSHAAQEDFNRLYPQNECRQFVVNFAVTHPDFSKLRPAELQKKYSLPAKFFFSPNQFWQHKNHRVIFEALSILRDRSVECAVVFSGNPIDHRAPGYFDSLTAVIRELKLENYVYLLGFIDRKELLCLAQSSIAIIQPSLFEGWSTVVEDAKALRKHILLSDIPVHREQIQLNSDFFDPKSALHLADLMERVWRNPPADGRDNYARQVANFGKNFVSVLDSLLQPNFAKQQHLKDAR